MGRIACAKGVGLRYIEGNSRGDSRGVKGDSFYTWSDFGVDMRHPAFGEAIGGGYPAHTQTRGSYRKCQLFFPIFIKKTQIDGGGKYHISLRINKKQIQKYFPGAEL